jgi:hypothetical protein
MASRFSQRHRLLVKVLGVLLTLAGIGLFIYLIYSVGIGEIFASVASFGFDGFAIILVLYFLRMAVRASAWRLSVYEPYSLTFRDTLEAVLIGEAMSSIIPLGIAVSGTSKAIAVRHRVPFLAGLSSVATENLFYSVVTSVFIVLGAVSFLRLFPLDDGWTWTIDALIVAIILIIAFIVLMVVRRWHPASGFCNFLYSRGILTGILKRGRLHVRNFENTIYDFYRAHPERFLPICLFEIAYHVIGVVEVWYIIYRLSDTLPSLLTAFLLESVSRLVTIMFKLIPMAIGVDEAGAQFVGETVALGAGIAVTLAVIRKGRIIFWAAIGMAIAIYRGFSFAELTQKSSANRSARATS